MTPLYSNDRRYSQMDHPQNPMVRESCETEEEKLCRALGLTTKGDISKGTALRGYDGFLALLYAFTEQTNSEVRNR